MTDKSAGSRILLADWEFRYERRFYYRFSALSLGDNRVGELPGLAVIRRRTFVAAGVSGVAAAFVPFVAPAAPSAPAASAAATSLPTLYVLVAAAGTYPARPAGAGGGSCRYIGPTQPGSWLVGDEWIQPSS